MIDAYTRLRLSCRALLIIVLVRLNFYSALLAGRFGCFSCLLPVSTLSPEELQTAAKTLADSYPSDLNNSFVYELCHFAMFADTFKDDEPGDISTELFLYKLIIQQAPTDICLLVPPYLEKWGYKFFFARSARESCFVPPPYNPRRRPD